MTRCRAWKCVVLASLTSLPILLFSSGPSRAAVAAFDSRGPALDLLLRDIRQDQLSVPGAVPGSRAVRPVIITVSGLALDEIGYGLEFKHIKELWQWLFPGKNVDDQVIREKLEEYHALYDNAPAAKSKKPQNYLELDMREAVQKYGLDVEVVNFDWSRDPEDSEQATAEFQKKLLELSSAEGAAGRPIYIIAHSWGTVLMHDALNNLDQQGKPVQVRRLVTMGSPIVPSSFFVWVFKEIEDIKERLQKTVRRPAGVENWSNLWAGYDSFSGVIDVADMNVRVDMGALPYARRLEALLKTDQKKQAQADLEVLGRSTDWHESYRCAFTTELKSLGEAVRWDVLQENLGQVLPVEL